MSAQADPGGIETLEPAPVWRLFAGIAATPRPSKQEVQIRQHVRSIAQASGLRVREDHVGNLVIEVPASPGRETTPITVLQGHLDMVCEKNADTTHNFERDPIRLVVEKDPTEGQLIVRADGTTLGADNGIGVALALAAACSPEVIHGPLELLFTADEETGMTGAQALGPDSFRGRRMLNLDSEEDDALYIGCAGGCDTTLSWDFTAQGIGQDAGTCRVVVTGLRGGHSGSDIHRNRGNAVKLLVRTLLRAHPERLQIAALSGGSKRNAIPREAAATVSGPPATLTSLQAAAQKVRDEAARESAEENLAIHVEGVPRDEAWGVLAVADTQRLLAALAALPHGVLGMHQEIEDLVETSNNVATVATEVGGQRGTTRVEVGTLSRSSSASRLDETLAQIAAVGRLAGADVRTGNAYPGWEPNVNSPTLATCRRMYAELFGQPPKVTAIHAGLECGIIAERVGGMDTVSLGPRIEGAHSPDERVYVASVQKSWQYLVAVLSALAGG